jgi:hypothetical protein
MQIRAFAVAAVLICTTVTVIAQPTLESAQMVSYTGSNYAVPPNPPGGSNTVTPSAFPNDALNSARAGPDGLRVVVNRTGHSFGIYNQQGFSNSWQDYGFSVVFDVEEASPFFYRRTQGFAEDALARLTLQAEGRPAVPLATFGDTSGILEPGRYTFSGDTNTRSYAGGGFFGPYDKTYSFTDTRLTVVPEPGAVSLLALPLLHLCRWTRRSPRR